ncbi:hypothetical protein [Novipirellula rosea]|uniref:Magnetosome protein MamS/MamX domain-containing protein n=1 Tax=Novipirellula rosea TaxID=1031540 RepID=A0ABP8NKM0_9BACT
MRYLRIFSRVSLVTAMLALAFSPALLRADEWEENTPYYEDDAWYDVSEWFDGNDYNPTDEAIGRWDDETYDASDAVTSSDQDNDIDWSTNSYGYYDNNANDWYYDYYDYGYTDYGDYNSDNAFDYTASYYDYDNDGLYDAYASYWDSDGDGVYDDISYYSFSDASGGNAEQAKKSIADAKSKQKSQQAKMTSFTGTIKSAKKVKTPASTNIVVQLADSSSGKTMIVDLGPANDFDTMPRLGQSVTANGVTYKAGDKTVLLAQKLERNGTLEQVNRSGRSYTGTIEKTMKSKIRSQDHQMVKIKTDKGKNLLVDLGPAKNLDAKISEGTKITVKGPAVKIKDRALLVATEVKVNGKTTDIKRVAVK